MAGLRAAATIFTRCREAGELSLAEKCYKEPVRAAHSQFQQSLAPHSQDATQSGEYSKPTSPHPAPPTALTALRPVVGANRSNRATIEYFSSFT